MSHRSRNFSNQDPTAKNNETKPLGFESYKEPIKSLGINLSYKHENKNNLVFAAAAMLNYGSSPLFFANEDAYWLNPVFGRAQF